MGHFSHSCKLSGLPLVGGTKAVLIVMKPVEKINESDKEQYGSSHYCTNDGPRIKFYPCWFPIKGTYDSYGRLDNIIEDDNTKLLEEFYELPIKNLVNIVTSNRKYDGFDEVLKEVMVDPENYKYGKPVYKAKFQEMLTYSAMWVHGELYDRISKETKDEPYDKVNLGEPILLETLGFVEQPLENNKGNFNRPFKFGDLTVYSNGRYLDNQIYTIKDFKRIAEKNGVVIDFSPIDGKSKIEQLYDVILPKINLDDIVRVEKYSFGKTLIEEKIKEWNETFPHDIMTYEKYVERISTKIVTNDKFDLLWYFLNDSFYTSRFITNPLTLEYFKEAKKGKLKHNLVDFWVFDNYMYCCGRFYDVIGSSPQDGEPYYVENMLKISLDIVNKMMVDYE